MKPPDSSTTDFERATRDSLEPVNVLELRLYVAGSSFRSTRAIQNAKEMCETHFGGQYQLEVIDIFQQPERAKADNVLAVPVLIRRAPPPIRRFVGDLSNRPRVLDGLDARLR